MEYRRDDLRLHLGSLPLGFDLQGLFYDFYIRSFSRSSIELELLHLTLCYITLYKGYNETQKHMKESSHCQQETTTKFSASKTRHHHLHLNFVDSKRSLTKEDSTRATRSLIPWGRMERHKRCPLYVCFVYYIPSLPLSSMPLAIIHVPIIICQPTSL